MKALLKILCICVLGLSMVLSVVAKPVKVHPQEQGACCMVMSDDQHVECDMEMMATMGTDNCSSQCDCPELNMSSAFALQMYHTDTFHAQIIESIEDVAGQPYFVLTDEVFHPPKV